MTADPRQDAPAIVRRLRLALTIGLGIYGAWLAKTRHYSWIDSLDTAVHETGHLLFAVGGEWLGFAGGTLFQLLVPLVFVGYFVRRHDGHAASVALWWVAQNCWNISVYVADATAQALPLVGGGEHDWAYLLGRAGWLAKDQELAGTVHFLGVVLLVASVVWGLRTAQSAVSRHAGAGQ